MIHIISDIKMIIEFVLLAAVLFILFYKYVTRQFGTWEGLGNNLRNVTRQFKTLGGFRNNDISGYDEFIIDFIFLLGCKDDEISVFHFRHSEY